MVQTTNLAQMAPMAGQGNNNRGAQLCDYCHSKPKYPPYNYCSKTCAGQAVPTPGAQAASNPNPNVHSGYNSNAGLGANGVGFGSGSGSGTLCNHCHKNPKHPGHDFCGKGCASKAQSQVQTTTTTTATATKGFAPQNQSQPQAGKKHSGFKGANGPGKVNGGGGTGVVDPTQIANLVVQQLQTLLPPNLNGVSLGSIATAAAASGGGGGVNGMNGMTSGAGGVKSSILATAKQLLAQAHGAGAGAKGGPMGSNTNFSNSNASQSQQIAQVQEPAECLIPGCGQPVYVDANGLKASSYCSMRHREEAVTKGLAEPCIFCLHLPQSDSDYFCSRECREESMSKIHRVMAAIDDDDDDDE